MKRIIFCVTNDISFDQRMQRICRSLSTSGYDVTLVGRTLDSSVPLMPELFSQHRLKCFFNKGKAFYIEYNLRLFCWLLFQQFDAVCAIDLDTILPALFTAKLKRKKLVYDAHEYFPEVPEVTNRPLVKKVWQWVEKFALPKTNAAYTVSQSIADEFKKLYSVNVDVIRNISLMETLPDAQKEQATILYQGALNEGRGLHQLLESVKDLDAKIWIAGDGDITDELKAFAAQIGVQHKVVFYGKSQPNELKKLTSKATIGFNVLEEKGKSYYYSLSNKTFDYIHAGVPQLMSNFPEMLKLNEQFEIGIIVKECTPNAIALAINRLLQNANFYETLCRNCLQAKQELNWQAEEKKLLNIYEQLFR
jgi:glycosyltransferase involved in cell wall biosynthesis